MKTQVRNSTLVVLLALLAIPVLLLVGCSGDNSVAPPGGFEAWKAGQVNSVQEGYTPETVLVLFGEGSFRLTAYDGNARTLVGTWTETDGVYTLTLTEKVSDDYDVGVQLFGRRVADQISIWGVDRTEEQALGFVSIQDVCPFVGPWFGGWQITDSNKASIHGWIETNGDAVLAPNLGYSDAEGSCTPQGLLSLHLGYPDGRAIECELQLPSAEAWGSYSRVEGTCRDQDGLEGTMWLMAVQMPPGPPG